MSHAATEAKAKKQAGEESRGQRGRERETKRVRTEIEKERGREGGGRRDLKHAQRHKVQFLIQFTVTCRNSRTINWIGSSYPGVLVRLCAVRLRCLHETDNAISVRLRQLFESM